MRPAVSVPEGPLPLGADPDPAGPVTLFRVVLLHPALYYGCVYLFRSPTQEALDSLVWAGALAAGGMAAEIAFRSS